MRGHYWKDLECIYCHYKLDPNHGNVVPDCIDRQAKSTDPDVKPYLDKLRKDCRLDEGQASPL